MSAAQVINRIISTAKPKGEGTPNAIYGYGILDADAALSADVPEVTANPLGSIAEWIHVHRRGMATPPAVDGTPPTTVPMPKPTLVDATAPVPVAMAQAAGPLPPTLVLGSLGLLVLLAAGGSVHLIVARRRLAGAAGVPGSVSDGPDADGPDAGSTPLSPAAQQAESGGAQAQAQDKPGHRKQGHKH